MGGLILYLHGFCSSPASWKARLLGEEMARRGLAAQFVCPALSPVPAQAIADLSRFLESVGRPVTLIGSSLGGHYASYLAAQFGLPAVLVNPAVVSALSAERFIGEHSNFHSGERFLFTAEHAAQLVAQTARPDPARLWLLLETGDEVLDYRAAQAHWFGCRQSVYEGGDHSFTRFPELMPQLIEFAGL